MKNRIPTEASRRDPYPEWHDQGPSAVIVRIVHQRRNMPALVYFEDIGA